LLREALNQLGEDYTLEILTNGEEALQFVQEHRTGVREPEPCVIVLYLHLPRYDGLAILRAVREAPARDAMRIRCVPPGRRNVLGISLVTASNEAVAAVTRSLADCRSSRKTFIT